jgi:hypothetical protein
MWVDRVRAPKSPSLSFRSFCNPVEEVFEPGLEVWEAAVVGVRR